MYPLYQKASLLELNIQKKEMFEKYHKTAKNKIFVVILFCAHKVPTVNPIVQDAITPKVAMYVVTKALSHHGLSAINNAKFHPQ